MPSVFVTLAACAGARGDGASIAVVHAYSQAEHWAPTPIDAPLYDDLRRVVAGANPIPDPALAVVAAQVARRVAADPQASPPSEGVVQALSWLAGVTDPIPTVLTLRGPAGVTLDPLAPALRELFANDHPTHSGTARLHAGSADVLVVVLSQRRVRLEPVARQVSMGTHVAIRGTLDDGLRTPTLAITHPDGRTEETQLGDQLAFHGQVPLTERGVYQIEVTADSSLGSTVVANFPIYVDVAPPETPESTSSPHTEGPATAEASLLQSINDARRHAHVAPVALLPTLTEVARAHSADMAAHHYVAHNAPDGSTPTERLRRAGLQSSVVIENVSRGYTAREIHEGLMASPGHRANVLNPQATHVGIGASVENGVGGGLLVTEDFIEVPPAIDVGTAPTTILDSVNRLRQSRGAHELGTRGLLQAVAQATAEGYFASDHPTQEAVLNEATAQLGHAGLLFRRVVVSAALGPRLEEIDRMETLMDPEMVSVGIGVAQGDRPDAPPRSIFVVYVLAVPR